MTFKQYLTLVIALVLINVFTVGSVHYLDRHDSAPKAGDTEGSLLTVYRQSTVFVGSSSTGVASSSSQRRILILQNLSSNSVYCSLGTAAAVGSNGLWLNASSTERMPIGDGPVYAGSINCIASSTSAVLVTEG